EEVSQRDGHGAARYADLVLVARDLALAGATLDLLDAVRVHPEPRAPAADVPAARRDRLRAADADVLGLEVVQRLTALDAGEAQAFEVEHVEQAEPVVHVLEVQVVHADAGALEEHACVACGRLLALLEGRHDAAGLKAVGSVVENVD